MMVTYLNLIGGRGQGKKWTDVRDIWERRLTRVSAGCGEKIDDVQVFGLHNWACGGAHLSQCAQFIGAGCIL